MNNTDLSILSWNVRGLNDAAHRELVRQSVDCARPAVVCLQETKIGTMRLPIVLETLGQRLDSFLALDANGTRGGILLGWDKEVVSVSDVEYGSFTITASVTVLLSNLSFRLTACYGPADDGRKEEFLLEMLSLMPPHGAPWLVAGDFNLIYQASDKNNLNLNRRLMGKFRAAIDECELLEICLHNRRFTWSNERENPTLVRLDRAFCNSAWEVLFPSFALNALSTAGSDHCPIMLTCQALVPRKASFKFENFWLHVHGFKEVVQQAWTKQQHGPAHTVLKNKLAETARALRTWSKSLFSRTRIQLHIANEIILRLDIAQESRLLSDAEWSLRRDLKLRALGLAAVERCRRKQASRVNWVRAGDACTRFFHLKMSARRRRKYIYTLKRQDGTLTWDHHEKEEIIRGYFTSIMGAKEQRSRTINWDRLAMSRI
jgi:exonuclease III